MIDARVTGLLRRNDHVNGVVVRIGGQILEIGAKVVIGADGYASNVGRWSGLGQPKRATPILEYGFVNVKNLDPKTIYVFSSREFCPGGHASWVPVGEDSVCLVLLYLPSWLRSRVSIYEMHAKLRNHPAIKDKLEKAVPVSVIGAGGYMASPLPKTVANGMMMAGDAAGQGYTAQVAGIGSSFTCGHLAGKVAAQAARENDASEGRLQEYEDTWRGTIGKTILAHIEANDLFLKIIDSDKLTEKAVTELGEHFIGLIILSRLHMGAAREWVEKVCG
jgi:digeranylgeranylglycerophospholipid reductase